MSVTRDMVRTWRQPRAVMDRLLRMGQREDRALAFLMGGCFLNFLATWPYAVRVEELTGTSAKEQITGSLFLWIFIAPLFFYGLSAVIHLVAKVLGGKGTFYTARLSLFWTLLATTPAALLYGLLRGFNGDDTGTMIVGALWTIAFFVIGSLTLIEAEKGA
ncbi:hypothetical protein BVC71_05460 [Marivivens niveibacter]|uniref:Yip1 domain-containing protein n=1 Tax=Marivivens niveibacter TaxID=1930667 RepID=A0A251X427_9RHOB|nr:YIP1 family protein [Marivivens niveibacter]OUD10913.1 hypothetical protein BVC71_05460 [Marivivens niveibacter]